MDVCIFFIIILQYSSWNIVNLKWALFNETFLRFFSMSDCYLCTCSKVQSYFFPRGTYVHVLKFSLISSPTACTGHLFHNDV